MSTQHDAGNNGLTSAEEKRRWVAALHEQNLEQEKLFQLIASLANLLDRDVVVETMRTILSIEPDDKGECVHCDEALRRSFEEIPDLTVKFGANGRVVGIYRTIDGQTIRTTASRDFT